MRYNWPGNIRELENAIERAMLLTEGQLITADDLRLGEIADDADGARGAGAGARFRRPGFRSRRSSGAR